MAFVSGRPLEADPRTPAVTQRVVVKMQPVAPAPPGAVDAPGDTMWAEIAAQFPGVQFAPYFTEPAAPDGAVADVAPMSDTAGLDSRRYVAVDVPAELPAEAVAREFRNRPNVETAYREGGPVPPPVNAGDDPRNASQGYLDAAPIGVDARFAWAQGIDGEGVGFVDLERGWTLLHEDLAEAGITIISGVNTDFHGHGTAVLGQVAMVDNNVGGVGVAPRVRTRVVSQWREGFQYKTAEAIASAVAVMARGDVLLLEAQTVQFAGGPFLPVEIEPLVFDAIRAAVDRGIIVIEAGANGFQDLDQFVDLSGRQTLNRNRPDFQDSGAIMVGAGAAAAPHGRLGFSNFGSRIDCFAWGEQIDTSGDGGTGEDPSAYTGEFGGTSGASPIVTGCALLLQSMREGAGLPRYTPAEMRALLSSAELNTPSADPSTDLIGVMPNLKAIIQSQTAAPPPGVLQPTALTDN